MQIQKTSCIMSIIYLFQIADFQVNLGLIFCTLFALTNVIHNLYKYRLNKPMQQQVISNSVTLYYVNCADFVRRKVTLLLGGNRLIHRPLSALLSYRRQTYCIWVTNGSLSHGDMFIHSRLVQERSRARVAFCLRALISVTNRINNFIFYEAQTVQPLKFGNGSIISPHTLRCMWLLIHPGINIDPC